VTLQKEDVKRNNQLDPIEPIELEWINRFSFRLPLKDQNPNNYLNLATVEFLPEIVPLPPSLSPKIALLFLEHTTIKDPKSYHHKQWVGMRYSKDGKYKTIIAGFRLIKTERPFSKREVHWCGGIPQDRSNPNPEVLQKSFQEVLTHLEKEIGMILAPETIDKLKIMHNYTSPNIDHVWAF